MTIKHLVLAGGGPSLFQTLGAIEHLQNENYIQRENIETIYGTSAGSIVGTLFSLKYDDQDMINDYVIKRPWKDVFSVKIQNILDAYTKKGIFDRPFFEKSFKPLLEAKDLTLDISLKEFYEYSGIEQHFFTFELNDFQLVDVSYKTHPNVKLVDAIQMSCAIPVLISPVCLDEKCYIDGGVSCNYPLKQCVEQHKNTSEILGFRNVFEENYEKTVVNEQSNLLDFIMNFLFKVIFSLSVQHHIDFHNNSDSSEKPLEIICNSSFLNIGSMKKAVDSMEERKNLFQNGVASAKAFLREPAVPL